MGAHVTLRVFLYLTVHILQTECSLHSKFHHFEVLRHADIHHEREKRDADDDNGGIHHLSFRALGRRFGLSLTPGSLVTVANRVRTTLVNNDREKHVFVDTNDLFSGSVLGRPGSTVDAMYDGGWSAQIYDGVEHFAIDPLGRHVDNDTTEDMIIYRAKDIRYDNFSEEPTHFQAQIPDYVVVNGSGSFSGRRFSNGRFRGHNDVLYNNTRLRRDLNYYNVCDIQAVMDAYTFKRIGQANVKKASKLLLYWYQAANRIFVTTKFGPYRGMGIRVTSILLYPEYSKLESDFNNKNTRVIDSNKINYILAEHGDFLNFCLVHLTTQRRMTNNVLGVAFIPDNPQTNSGGICGASQQYSRWTGTKTIVVPAKAYNVGTSTLRKRLDIITDTTYTVVLAHELGHSWGSEHDPSDVEECTGANGKGGHYIMWATANPGTTPNSNKFSSCSIFQITPHIEYKSPRCFLPLTAFSMSCGNGIVDPHEECDEGNTNSTCCSDKCLLKKGAHCSSSVHPCCGEDCKVAPKGTPCQRLPREPCLEENECSGSDFSVCPVSTRSLPNESPCPDSGVCMYGRCLSFCEHFGAKHTPPRQLVPCSCVDSRRTMCQFCCRDIAEGGRCETTHESMEEGAHCHLGACHNGRCTEEAYKIRRSPLTLSGQLVHITIFISLAILFFWVLNVYRRWTIVCPGRTRYHSTVSMTRNFRLTLKP